MAKARKKTKTKASTLRVGKKRGATKSPRPRSKTEIAAAPNKGIGGQDSSNDSSQNAWALEPSPEVLNRLWTIIDSRKGVDVAVSHSARLLAKGTPQVVQKLGEELIECLIEAMAGNHAGLVTESADVLYHLLVTWVDAGIEPEEVWAELTRREEVSRQSEDIPLKRLPGDLHVGTSKIP
jgi:phosphoribosyl-ATP pyrophosphohydrolase